MDETPDPSWTPDDLPDLIGWWDTNLWDGTFPVTPSQEPTLEIVGGVDVVRMQGEPDLQLVDDGAITSAHIWTLPRVEADGKRHTVAHIVNGEVAKTYIDGVLQEPDES